MIFYKQFQKQSFFKEQIQMVKSITMVAFFFNVTIAVIISTLWMKNLKYQLDESAAIVSQSSDVIDQSYNIVIDYIRTFARDLFVINSFHKIIMLLSVYLFAHFVVKSFLEFLAEYFGLKLQKIIKCLNNIIESFLLFTMILGLTLLPMFITNYQISLQQSGASSQISTQVQEKYSQKLIFLILETFLYGRIVFSIGYLFGTVIGLQSFRSVGLGLTFASVVVAFSNFYDLNVFAYF